ncbi:MAG: c-type cytochrome [Burkholderiaceae bacterium]
MHANRTRHRLLAAALLLSAAAAQAQTAAAQSPMVVRARHVCIACHGEGGRSDNAVVPSIAGQTRDYLAAQLKDFRGQVRVEAGSRGYMWGISALLDDDTIAGLADYYAAQKPAAGRDGDASLVQTGRQLFVNGAPERGVLPCASCHGEAAQGNKEVPRLAGQQADYIVAQLKEFGTALRPHAIAMRAEVKGLSEQEMRSLATYVQSR